MEHESPCQTLTDCIQEKNDAMNDITDRLIGIDHTLAELHGMKQSMDTIAEILTLWNNAKGFTIIFKAIGKTAIFLVACGVAYSAFVHGLGSGK